MSHFCVIPHFCVNPGDSKSNGEKRREIRHHICRPEIWGDGQEQADGEGCEGDCERSPNGALVEGCEGDCERSPKDAMRLRFGEDFGL